MHANEPTAADRERAEQWRVSDRDPMIDVLASHFAAHRIAAEKADREQIVTDLRAYASLSSDSAQAKAFAKAADLIEKGA